MACSGIQLQSDSEAVYGLDDKALYSLVAWAAATLLSVSGKSGNLDVLPLASAQIFPSSVNPSKVSQTR